MAKTPIILCGTSNIPAGTFEFMDYLETEEVMAFGGEVAVPNSVIYRYITK